MIERNFLDEARLRWEENRSAKSGRARGLILQDFTDPLDPSWWSGQSAWKVMTEKQVPERFDVLVIENLTGKDLESEGSFIDSPDGKFLPSQTQRILAAATQAVRESKPILVSTPAKFGLLKKVNTSSIDIAKLDVGALLAGEELLYLLQSYCESIDEELKPKVGSGALYMTPIERRLAKLMLEHNLIFKSQVPIGTYFADFLIEGKLVVECDGEAWHDPDIDQKRDDDLLALGFQTIRITGRAIFSDSQGSILRIKEAVKGLAKDITFEPIDLTIAQRRAASHWNGPVLVVAPAGSGKTKVIAERIKFLSSRGASPNRICAVSFTKAAVGEIADRIQEIDEVETTTLHSLAYKISKEIHGTKILIQDVKTPNIPTRLNVIDQALGELKLSAGKFGQSRGLLEAIAHYRNSLVIPDLSETIFGDLKEATDAEKDKKFLEIHDKYEEILKKKNLTDFDGQVLDAIRILQQNPLARMAWSRKYDYWMVDEFQDLAPPKLMLLRLLVSPARNLMAVGDDDQIIYGFAGSRPEIFSILNRDWRDMTPLPLDVNFRCPHDLVRRSQWLVSNNKLRIPKTITPNRELTAHDNVIIQSAENYEQKALSLIVEEIKNGRPPSDIAVLFRVSMAAAPVELLLTQKGIKFVPLVKNSLLYNPTIKWLRAWLRVVNRVGSFEDWRTVVYRPNRYFSTPTVDWLLASDAAHAFDPLSRIELGILQPDLIPRRNENQGDDLVADALRELRKTLVDAQAVGDSPSRQLRMLDLDDCLSKEEDERLKRNLGAVNAGLKPEMDGKSVAPVVAYKIFFALAEASESFTHLENWLNQADIDPDIALNEDVYQRSVEDRVILSSIHGFKGKERPVVIVLGPEGAMPDPRALTDVQREEERRVAYVAVTRARERLLFAASSQYARELTHDQAGRTWQQYRDGIERKNPPIQNPIKTQPGVVASTEKKPGTLDKILTWFLGLFEN